MKRLFFLVLFCWNVTMLLAQAAVYQPTSRPEDEISKVYPYNITLKKADGTLVQTTDVFKQNGKPTILLFWLTTCVPCRYELEAIHSKYEGWKQEADFNLYAISTDFPRFYDDFVKRVQESGWKFEAYNDVNREFQYVMPGELNGLPQVFILDGKGNIIHHKRRYGKGDEDLLFEEVRKLVK